MTKRKYEDQSTFCFTPLGYLRFGPVVTESLNVPTHPRAFWLPAAAPTPFARAHAARARRQRHDRRTVATLHSSRIQKHSKQSPLSAPPIRLHIRIRATLDRESCNHQRAAIELD